MPHARRGGFTLASHLYPGLPPTHSARAPKQGRAPRALGHRQSAQRCAALRRWPRTECTAQHSTAQHGTAQHSAAQRSAAQRAPCGRPSTSPPCWGQWGGASPPPRCRSLRGGRRRRKRGSTASPPSSPSYALAVEHCRMPNCQPTSSLSTHIAAPSGVAASRATVCGRQQEDPQGLLNQSAGPARPPPAGSPSSLPSALSWPRKNLSAASMMRLLLCSAALAARAGGQDGGGGQAPHAVSTHAGALPAGDKAAAQPPLGLAHGSRRPGGSRPCPLPATHECT